MNVGSVTNQKLEKITKQKQNYNLDEITYQELIAVIKKFKKGKAPGPDEVPMEIFKQMNKGNLEEILKIINKWWNEEEIPEEQLRARIVLIFKNKGNSNDIDNYRPIALTNSMYKIFTAIIQKRLCAQMDEHLQKTQYGFRKTNPQHMHSI